MQIILILIYVNYNMFKKEMVILCYNNFSQHDLGNKNTILLTIPNYKCILWWWMKNQIIHRSGTSAKNFLRVFL